CPRGGGRSRTVEDGEGWAKRTAAPPVRQPRRLPAPPSTALHRPSPHQFSSLPPVGVHAHQRGFAGRHLVAAAQRFLGGPLHLCRDVRLDVRESRRGDAPLLQVFLVQAYRVALPPALEALIRQRVARLALVRGAWPA